MQSKRTPWCLLVVAVLASTSFDSARAQGEPVTQGLGLFLGAGADFDTDAFLIQAGIDCGGVMNTPFGLTGLLAIGVGNQEFGQADNYNVIRLAAKGRYEFSVTDGGNVAAYPFAGIGLYRWSADYGEGEFGGTVTETEAVVDIGAGVQYNNIGVEVLTSLSGPSAGVRVHYRLGLGNKEDR